MYVKQFIKISKIFIWKNFKFSSLIKRKFSSILLQWCHVNNINISNNFISQKSNRKSIVFNYYAHKITKYYSSLWSKYINPISYVAALHFSKVSNTCLKKWNKTFHLSGYDLSLEQVFFHFSIRSNLTMTEFLIVKALE